MILKDDNNAKILLFYGVVKDILFRMHKMKIEYNE